MTLLDSEGEKEDDLDSLEWEQQVSADDEQTFESSVTKLSCECVVNEMGSRKCPIELPERG
jgi:hypothetical protein